MGVPRPMCRSSVCSLPSIDKDQQCNKQKRFSFFSELFSFSVLSSIQIVASAIERRPNYYRFYMLFHEFRDSGTSKERRWVFKTSILRFLYGSASSVFSVGLDDIIYFPIH